MSLATAQITLTDLNDVRQYILYANGNYKTQIFDPNNNSYAPSFSSTNLVITPELYVSGGDGSNLLPSTQVKSVKWYEGTQTDTPLAETTGGTTGNGYTYAIPTGAVTSTAKTLTIKSNIPSNVTSQIFTCVVVYTDPQTNFDVTIKVQYEIVKVTNGSAGADAVNALTAILTNESSTVAADSAGNNGIYSATGTNIRLFEGATELTYDGTGTANGTWKVTAAVTSGTIVAGAITDGGEYAVVGNASGMTTDTASITYTITGKRANGTAISLTKIQTFTRTKNGSSPTLYRLIPSANAIQQNISNVYNPATITASATSAVGNGTPTAYGARFIIAESTDGTTYNDKYTSSGTEPTAGKTYTPSATNVKSIRIRMYIAGTGTPTHGTTQMLDEQAIPVVKDGATGATGTDAYFLNLWTPNGDTIRNSGGEILLQADLYKGSGKVTPTAFKWYIQDPAATTASGGDADGGDGWRLINSVATATTAPTLAQVANANTKLTAGTYYVKYTWLGLSGETLGSTEASQAVTAGNDLKVTIPAFPTNAIGAKVYIGTTSGVLKYAGDISTSAGNLVISRYDTSTPAIPTVNTATTVNAATLTVEPHAISGIEGFKVVATAPTTGIKYSAVIMVKDVQDQIQANVLGASIFKNGEGSTVLTVQLIQAGAVISNAGYKFTWALYNPNGTLVKTYPTTADTLTVPSTDVSGVGNLIVDVDKA